MLVWVTYMIWDLTWYFRIWLFSYIFGEFWLLLLLIRLSRTILKYAQYYFQFTFSSFESVMCPSKVSKLRFMLDFKCFSPRNSMPNLISFGIRLMASFSCMLFMWLVQYKRKSLSSMCVWDSASQPCASVPFLVYFCQNLNCGPKSDKFPLQKAPRGDL